MMLVKDQVFLLTTPLVGRASCAGNTRNDDLDSTEMLFLELLEGESSRHIGFSTPSGSRLKSKGLSEKHPQD